MSFILDALKKSESERQQQGRSEFSQVPMSQDSSRPPAWIWLLAVLLAINLVVLAGVLLRPDRAAVTTQAESGEEAGNFTERVERAIREAPPVTPPAARIEPVRPASQPAAPTDEGAAASPTVRTAPATTTASSPTSGIPDIEQLRAAGELPIGDLRLDIHVFSDEPADRFVFINMVKHREGSTTSDGLAVDAITPDGVVLRYRGKRFLLPRQ